MSKIKVLQQVLDPSGAGGVSSEYRALKDSSLLDKYDFVPMILNNVHRGISIKNISFYYKNIRSENPDIIHIRGAAIDGLNAIIAAKIARKGKILVAVHGMYSDLVYISKIKRWICKNIIERLIFDFADGISCVCKNASERKCFEKYRGKMLPFVYNRMPHFDLEKRETCRKEIRMKYSIPQDAVVGLYVGRITREKGLDTLFNASVELLNHWPSQFFLLFVGDGDYKKQIEKQFLDNGIKAIFVGNQIDVEKFYYSGDFFILPSLHENHSISLLEACAAGLPSIATSCGGNVEIIDNQIGILYSVGDYYGLYKAILKMYDYKVREQFKQNLNNHSFVQFSDKSVDLSLDNVYQRLMNG